MKKNIASVFLILGISFFVFLEFRIKFNNYNSFFVFLNLIIIAVGIKLRLAEVNFLSRFVMNYSPTSFCLRFFVNLFFIWRPYG